MIIFNDPSKFGHIPDPPEPPSDEWFEDHCPRCKFNQENRWIPVSEKLPENREEVLIYLSSNRITIGLYNSHVLPLAPYKPIGWGVNAQTAVHNFCSDDVVAWMPLPEPYKAERGET